MKTAFFTQNRSAHTAVFDTLLTIIILLGATLLCLLLRPLDQSNNYVSMIFILAVFFVARFTTGYRYGVAAALCSVLAVNYIFTYPFFRFNFTLAGYPLAALSMLLVAVITGTLTTQTKQSEALRLEAEKEKTRSNLLRAVSHDLRTPLTTILGAVSSVVENDEALSHTERVSLLSGVQDDAQWLIRMVENLLTITRIGGEGGAKIVKQAEAVEEVVAEAVTKFQKRFPQQAVAVQVPQQLILLPMDAVLIEQVLINLLENAVLHGKTASKICLTVEATARSVMFTVQDNGVGIASDILPRIFEAGMTQTGCESDSRRNMGIGLSVCRTIVKAHNGNLYAENAPEGGAVFRFILPMGEENHE